MASAPVVRADRDVVINDQRGLIGVWFERGAQESAAVRPAESRWTAAIRSCADASALLRSWREPTRDPVRTLAMQFAVRRLQEGAQCTHTHTHTHTQPEQRQARCGSLSAATRLIAVAFAVVGAVATATGQSVPEYDLIDLGELPGVAAGDVSEIVPEAINENLIVAGHLAGTGIYGQGFVWSWSTPHSLIPRQMLGLRDMSGFVPTSEGRAYAINNSDLVVGHSFFPAPIDTDRPVRWPLTTFNPGSSALGDETVAPQVGSAGSHALGVNDQSPPVIVGEELGICSSHAFSFTNGVYEQLPPPGAGSFEHAVDISTPAGAAPPLIVGWGQAGCEFDPPCIKGFAGFLWSGIGASAVASIVPNPLPVDPAAVQVVAVNNATERVGYYSKRETVCIDHAALWMSDGTLTALGLLTGWQTTATRAFGLNNSTPCGEVTVVGEDLNQSHGVRWQRDQAGAWNAADLNSTFSQPSTAYTYLVRSATDVNDCGWIAATATREGPLAVEIRAVVLRPHRSCPSDLDDDGSVGQSDMGIFLGYWYGTVGCWNWQGDLDHDGDVDALDLAVLLGAWGTCADQNTPLSGCGAFSSQAIASSLGLGDEAASTSVTDERLALAAAAAGFASFADFLAFLGVTDPTDAQPAVNAFAAVMLGQ